MYKNIICFFFFPCNIKWILWNVWNSCLKERVGKIRNTLRRRYGIWSEPLHSAFTRLVQDQLKTSHHLSFYMFFNFRSFARHPSLFLLGSWPLSTLASLFLHISSTFTSRFLHISLHYLKAFNHLSFLILASLIQSIPLSTSQPWAVWHKIGTKWHEVSWLFCQLLCFNLGSKIFNGYIIFRMPT